MNLNIQLLVDHRIYLVVNKLGNSFEKAKKKKRKEIQSEHFLTITFQIEFQLSFSQCEQKIVVLRVQIDRSFDVVDRMTMTLIV